MKALVEKDILMKKQEIEMRKAPHFFLCTFIKGTQGNARLLKRTREQKGTLENSWKFMGTQGNSIELKVTLGNLRELMGTHENSWELKGTQGNLRKLRGTQRNSGKPRGTQGNSRKVKGTQGNSREALVEVLEGKKLRKRGKEVKFHKS